MSSYTRGGQMNQGAAALVACQDPVTRSSVDEMFGQVRDALSAERRAVVVDLRAVTAIGNETLITLCAALRQASVEAPSLRIVGANGRIRRVLELCAIDGLECFPSLRRALARPRTGPADRRRLSWRRATAAKPF